MDRIVDLTNYLVKRDSEKKMWELQLQSLGYQPQTNEDAMRLSDRYDNLIEILEDQIRMSQGKESKSSARDGEIIMVS